MTELIEDKKEIDKIIQEKIRDKKIVLTTHYRELRRLYDILYAVL